MPILIALGGLLLLALVFGPQLWVRRVLRQHGADRPDLPGTGAELARHLLDEADLQSVTVEKTDLGDHYDPEAHAVRLLPQHHDGRSVAAVAVAAHEVSHAVQHARGEPAFKRRYHLVRNLAWIDRAASVILLLAPVVFAFVHVPAPHAPWIFGANGEPRTERLDSFFVDPVGNRNIDRAEAVRRVFAQATYVADQTLDVLEDLVDRPDPPVVVVISDHGPGTEIDFDHPATTDLVERSSNFLATFTPGQPHLFDGFTTPVNVFPTLFDGYFGMNVPKAADTIYAWKGLQVNLFPVTVPGTNSR